MEVGVPTSEYFVTSVSDPGPGLALQVNFEARQNDSMTGLDKFPTNRKFPPGSLAMKFGCEPVGYGELVNNDNAPPVPIVYPATFPELC